MKKAPTKTKPTAFDRVYYVTLAIKGFDGLLEVIGAILILFLNPPRIHYFLELAAQTEFAHRHQAVFHSLSTHVANGYTAEMRYFLVIYLLVHAAVKIISVVGLMMNKRWAYPFALITLGLMMLYQLYEIIFVRPSLLMILLTIFDVVVLLMIWREYWLRVLKPARNTTVAEKVS